MEVDDDAVIEIREYLDDADESKIVKTELLDISKELELIQQLTKMHEGKAPSAEQRQEAKDADTGALRAIVSRATEDDSEFIRDLAILSESGGDRKGEDQDDILEVLDKLQSAATRRSAKSSSSSSQSGWKKGFLS